MTVTEPIALDKSINTTEVSPRNIADVLAEELAGIAGAITTSESVEDILTDMATTKDTQIISGTAVFDTVDGNLVKALKVAITPSQAGSGTPSPSNIRPISGYTEEVISVKDSTDTTQKTYTTPFNQTVYGGTLDVLTGELTITHGYLEASSVTWVAQTNSRWFYNGLTAVIKIPPNNATPTETIADRFSAMSNNDMASTTNIGLSVNGGGSLVIRNGSTTIQPEGQIVYPLATPTTIQLTPQTVKSLVGENHIAASTGDVLQCKYSMMINGEDLAQLL